MILMNIFSELREPSNLMPLSFLVMLSIGIVLLIGFYGYLKITNPTINGSIDKGAKVTMWVMLGLLFIFYVLIAIVTDYNQKDVFQSIWNTY